MQSQILTFYILAIYATLISFNAFFSYLFFIANKKEINYKYNVDIWLGTIITFLVQIICQQFAPYLLPYVIYVALLANISLCRLIANKANISINIFIYIKISLLLLFLGVVIGYFGGSFSLAATPVVVGIVIPVISLLWQVYKKNILPQTISFKVLIIVTFFLCLHILNYPFLRPIEEFAPVGFIIASILCLALGYTIPAMIAEDLRMQYTLRLEHEVSEKVQELAESNVKLKKLFSDKQNLLRVTVHDICNPLTTIAMSANILARTPTINGDIKIKSLIEKLLRSIKIQTEIIEKVRQQDAIDSGKKHLEMQAIDFDAIIEKVLFIFHEKTNAKNIELKYSNTTNQPAIVMADAAVMTYQVICNLISNSIKFSWPNSHINILFSYIDSEYCLIKIQDFGIGMNQSLLSQIFDPDKSTSRRGTENEEGTGFGMPIVKKYIEEFGGKILVDSKDIENFPEDHGTVFSIILKRQ